MLQEMVDGQMLADRVRRELRHDQGHEMFDVRKTFSMMVSVNLNNIHD